MKLPSPSFAGGYGMLLKNPFEIYAIGDLQWRILRWLRPQAAWIIGQCEGFGVQEERWTTNPAEAIMGCELLG